MSDASPFSPDVVAQVMAHMNDDHTDDSLVIVRGLGGVDDATAAQMSGMDADGMDFAVEVGGASRTVRVPFSQRLTERPQIRAEVVRMYDEACAKLGIAPRTAEQH
jgi:putative heme iron utilization protein